MQLQGCYHWLRIAASARLLIGVLPLSSLGNTCPGTSVTTLADNVFTELRIVTQEAMGARAAVASDLDGDGDMDVVSASSTDNTVAWYRRLNDGSYGPKRQITFNSNGARIVTTGDIDRDGFPDVVVASYYDDTIGWFRNNGEGVFSDLIPISLTADDAQGVQVADIDGDGDLDVISASSGDNTIAWYMNLGIDGRFCEIKNIVDTNAIGARTVVAADLDGDGDLDLASASKDDNTIAWYPNADGSGHFPEKVVINGHAMGAYSLVASDVDADGLVDLVTASNADDTVAFYKNLGVVNGELAFERHVIFDKADFVLSVFAADFDGDGDVDVASASYFDSEIRWYENLDSVGLSWANHTIFVEQHAKGHYVFGEDIDGDGDTDLIAVMNGANKVIVMTASTSCDGTLEGSNTSSSCCRVGQEWDGTACSNCPTGKYGVIRAGIPECSACPSGCPRLEFDAAHAVTCAAVPPCTTPEASIAKCDCGENEYKHAVKDICVSCPGGHLKPVGEVRTLGDDGRTWAGFNESLCILATDLALDCDPGWFYNIEEDRCDVCANGFFSPGGSVMECQPCQAGYFCVAGQIEHCQAGHFSGMGAATCSPSPRGNVVPKPASSFSTPCQPGTYMPFTGMSECILCPRGTYSTFNESSLFGPAECSPCPHSSRTTTIGLGARHLHECVCEAGTYHLCSRRGEDCRINSTAFPTMTPEDFCHPCPSGATCEGDPTFGGAMVVTGVTTADLFHKSPFVPMGYMSIDDDVYRCGGTGEACPGADMFSDSDTMCNGGAHGVACANCPAGKSFTGGRCERCGNMGYWGVFAFLTALVCQFVLLMGFSLPKEPHGTLTTHSINSHRVDMLLSSTTTTIMCLWQTVWILSHLDAGWPTLFTDTFLTMGSLFDLSAFRLNCLTTVTQDYAVFLSILLQFIPAFTFGSLAILGVMANFALDGSRLWPHAPTAVSLAFSLYGTFFLMIARSATIGFSVIEHPHGGYSLKTFPAISDADPEYGTIQAISVVGILVWCVSGMVIVIWVLNALPRYHKEVWFRLSTVSMVVRYKPQCPWWYAWLIMVSWLVSLCSSVTTNGNIQVFYLGIVFTVYLLMLILNRPYYANFCFTAELVSSVARVLVVLSCQVYMATGMFSWMIYACVTIAFVLLVLCFCAAAWLKFKFIFYGERVDVQSFSVSAPGMDLGTCLPHTSDLAELLTPQAVNHHSVDHTRFWAVGPDVGRSR